MHASTRIASQRFSAPVVPASASPATDFSNNAFLNATISHSRMNNTIKEGFAMLKIATSIALLLGAALLAGCTGKGVDAPLATESEAAYRASLNKAWAEMSAPQQEAFNWAVSNFNLEQLIAKYPSMTPRSVIQREADEYIALKTEQAAQSTATLAANSANLAQQEKSLEEITAALSKITAKGLEIKAGDFFGRRVFIFEITNASPFNLSSVAWDAWLFLNGEENSTRHCSISSYFQYSGGLRAGAKTQATQNLDSFGCSNWDTLEVRNAKDKQYLLKLRLGSAKNFDEQQILPVVSPSRASYEDPIANALNEVEIAKRHKSSLTQPQS